MVGKSSAQRSIAITQAPIAGQLVSLTLPMLLALVSIMGLGVVDSYFVSFLGTTELAAIGFTTPVTAVITSIALGLGMAISSLTSRLIGEQDTANAARLISDGFILTFVVALLSVSVLWLLQEAIFTTLGARSNTFAFIQEYMNIWLLGAPLIMGTQVSSSTFRALGDTGSAARIAILMTTANMLLDPLFIFGWGPIPAFGVAGAATATVVAVLIAFAYSIYHLNVVERVILLTLPAIDALITNLRLLLGIAVPAVLANAIVPLIATVLTTVVAALGTSVVAGFGVAARLEAMALMVVYALSATLPMFIGQNLGAKKPARVNEAITLAFRFVFIWQGVLYLLLLLFGPNLASIFTSEARVAHTIIMFLALVPISHGMAGNVILVNVAMNVLGKPKWALYINLARLLCLTVPFAFIGRYLAGLEGILIGISVGNIFAFFVAKQMLNRVLKLQNIPPVRILSF